jgi:hypothetical protein
MLDEFVCVEKGSTYLGIKLAVDFAGHRLQ